MCKPTFSSRFTARKATRVRAWGYPQLEAAGGDEAIKIAKRYLAPIHLLITDMVLPQMNGPAIISLVSHIHPAIGVLIMSGYTADRLDRHLSDETPYLQKPFTPEQLLKQVRESLDAVRAE